MSKRSAKSTASKPSSSSTIRAAIVGLGMGWHHIAPYRRHPRCEVVAVCDVDGVKVDKATREFGVERGYTSIDDLLDAGGFDVVSLALPNDLHESVTIRFLRAGYHVLAEKPLAMNAKEGRRIVVAARKSGRKIALHMNQRMTPEHQLIRRAFDAGDLGAVAHIRAGWMRMRGIPTWGAGWFYRRERSGGGPLIDLGVHMLDSALWCCGFPKVLTVSGQTHNVFGRRDVPDGSMDVEDFAVAFLRLEGGATIVLEASWASFHDEREEAYLHVYGTAAGAHRSTVFAPGWIPTTKFHFSRRTHGALTKEAVVEMPADFPTVQEDLVQAILDDREPTCTVEQGLAVMEVLDAIAKSASSGRDVVIARG